MTTMKANKGKVDASAEGFAGLSAKSLKSLATKIKKCDAAYKIHKAIDAALGTVDAAATPLAVMSHLVVAGYLDPMPSGVLLGYFADADLDEPTATAIAESLAARDERGGGIDKRTSSLSWLEGWPEELDRVVYRAYGVAPSAFAERAARFDSKTQRGLAFVARRRGADIEPEMAQQIRGELARGQATGYGISLNCGCPFIDDDGAEVDLAVGDLDALRIVALRFGPAEAWDRALAEATLRNEWGLIENVASAIEQLPLAEITRLFATRFTMFGDSSSADEHIVTIMDRRKDTPEELLAPLAHTPEAEQDAERLRAVYAAAAARKRSG